MPQLAVCSTASKLIFVPHVIITHCDPLKEGHNVMLLWLSCCLRHKHEGSTSICAGEGEVQVGLEADQPITSMPQTLNGVTSSYITSIASIIPLRFSRHGWDKTLTKNPAQTTCHVMIQCHAESTYQSAYGIPVCCKGYWAHTVSLSALRVIEHIQYPCLL